MKLRQLIPCLLGACAGAFAAESGDIAPRLPLDELQLFAQVFDQVRNAYVEEIDDRVLLQKAVTGLLGQLDPHSAFLEAESYTELKEHTTGEFGGIGVELGLDRGYVSVVSPIDDTPAARAGLQPGDLILQLDDRSTQGMSLEEAISLMRGDKGSTIKLTLGREGATEPLVLSITRDLIAIKSIRKEVLEPGFAYLRIAQFQEQTGAELTRAIAELRKQEPALKGMVIDLRNNPGGLLPASIDVADALLDNGLIVYTEGRIASSNTRAMATPGDALEGIPLTVLINEGTASAAEIVAGALKDHRRALIVGTRSFGKGSVQTVLPLQDGRAIKLTTARYFTPSGNSIQADGIQPDVEVRRAEVHELEPGFVIKESNLGGHLESGKKQPSPKHDAESGKPVDNQLHEAVNLLKALALFSRPADPLADQ
ncbi:MAG: S41 family peptidase [Gammaproteobacteria bacterium]|nr:S41 family peptidase [Gammaproteobacteria bacterium]